MTHLSRFAHGLSHLIVGSRRRAAVAVALWVVLIGTLAVLAPTVGDVTNNDHANDPPAGSPSMRAAQIAADEFSAADALPAIVVVHADTAPATRAAAHSLVVRIDALAAQHPLLGPPADAEQPGGAHLRAPDGRTEMIVVPVSGSPSSADFREAVDALRALPVGPGVQMAVAGPAGISTDAVAVFANGDHVLLLGTILLVMLLVFAIYRSPAMVFIALVSVGMAMRLAQTTGALMAGAGWFDISSQTASIMTVLLFGVGTDYVLLINARYREALGETSDPSAAMARALRGVAPVIATSAATVVLAMMALLVAVTPALTGFGPYLAVAVVSMALVAFTLAPPLLLLFGRRAFWPRRMEAVAGAGQGRIWGRVADLVARAPRRVAAASVALLLVLCLGLAGFSQTFDLVSGFRVATESATGQRMIADGFGPGASAPATVYVVADGPAPAPGQWAAVGRGLSAVPGVAGAAPMPRFSPDGRTGAYQVVFAGNPYATAALDRIDPLTEAATGAARAAGIRTHEVVVGGETAKAADTRAGLERDTWWIGALILAIVALMLVVLLRSLLAPLYLIAGLLLSSLAALGATTFITVTLLGDGGIGNRVVVYTFVFLMVLGVDYTIFIMSRYRQELAHRAWPDALHMALVRTGGVVSSAGVILAGTFAVLMTQPIRELFQFGLAMALGILLDTFIVRPLLVPAVIHLLGERALWPARPTVADPVVGEGT